MLTCVDGRGRKRLPDDGLAHVGCNEEGNRRAEAVALLEQLVQADHKHTGREQLRDEKDSVAGAEVLYVAARAAESATSYSHFHTPRHDEHTIS